MKYSIPLMMKLYFIIGIPIPFLSALLYAFQPSGTVKFFNGEPSDTASFWCSVASSADIPYAFLALNALILDSVKIKKLAIASNALYSIFHFGSFWYWHNYGKSHPSIMSPNFTYPVSIFISLFAAYWWLFHSTKWQIKNNVYNDNDRS